ncbi:glycosyltransferase family 4 protein [Mesorhizobium sp. M0220]|uniref:glycosyltransferase family 4 protein n=1 Tax=Mesorhizobium sp. M0220 TaxID=2956920 RepID=UPI003339198F
MPVFERLANLPDWEVKVFHACDFKGTKVVNASGPFAFPTKQMWSLPVKLATGKGGDALVPFSPSAFAELVKFQPDVIVCEGASNVLNNLLAFAFAKSFRVPMVQWGLGRIRGRAKSPLRALADLLILPMERSSDAVISYSKTGAEYFREVGLDEKKIFIATNVVDTEQRLRSIRAEEGRDSVKLADFNVLFVGALEPAKRVDLLIRAFARLRAGASRTTSLTIVGDGAARRDLENLATAVGAEGICFKGKMIDGVSRIFLDSDVFVLPGLGGLAVSDALIHGVPVICTIGDGCEADLIASNINGYFEPELDEELLFSRLYFLSENPDELSRLKSNTVGSLEGKDVNAYIETIRRAVESVAVSR